MSARPRSSAKPLGDSSSPIGSPALGAGGEFDGVAAVIDGDGKAEKGRFHGSSYFPVPWGETVAKEGENEDEPLVRELDLDTIREVRHAWRFFKDRRFETFGPLSDIRSV